MSVLVNRKIPDSDYLRLVVEHTGNIRAFLIETDEGIPLITPAPFVALVTKPKTRPQLYWMDANYQVTGLVQGLPNLGLSRSAELAEAVNRPVSYLRRLGFNVKGYIHD